MEVAIINIAVTAICLLALGIYFNNREKRLSRMADQKFLEIREKYLVQIAQRKAKEKVEIEKIRELLHRVESKHKTLVTSKVRAQNNAELIQKAQDIIKRTEKRSRQIEIEAQQKAQKYLDDQKKEIETKMVDLVMNVTKKVLTKSLDYDTQKELIEKTLMEIEGDMANDSRD